MAYKTLALICAFTLSAVPGAAWGSIEHKSIGDGAWTQALALIDKEDPTASSRLFQLLSSATETPKDKRSNVRSWLKPTDPTKEEPICAMAGGLAFARLSFGDLVSIYGDWAVNTEEVNNLKFAERVDSLKKIIFDLDEPSNDEFKYMLELASVNYTHFSKIALDEYLSMHGKAMAAAKDPANIHLALHYEALALHSYTDLFAFGHMLENRELTQQLMEWAKKGNNLLALNAAGGAAKALGGMVNFYHNAYNFEGATVKNLAGDEWRATGDNYYEAKDNPKQREIILKGTAASVVAVLNTALGIANPPHSMYAASRYLPIQYRDTRAPIAPKDQLPNIAKLMLAMQKAGHPIDKHGFDWSLGILKYQDDMIQGEVPYALRIRQLHGE